MDRPARLGTKRGAVPEVIYYVAASLDGYIATSDGGIEWLSPFEGKGEDYGYAAFYASIDAVLLGRQTCRDKRVSERNRPAQVLESQCLSPRSIGRQLE